MKKILLIALSILSLTACKKFIDVNDNPNVPTTVPSKVLLPTTSVGMAWANGSILGLSTSLFVQYNAGIAAQQQKYDSYVLSPGDFNQPWTGDLYKNTINNLRVIIKQSQVTDPAYAGIAKIQLAYAFSLITDLWGDVPYSQAGMGTDFTQPVYDKQSDIYQGNAALGITSLFDLVQSGIADLDKPSVLKPGNDDVIYKGDLTKWKRAGNSLILKLANTISGVNPTLAKTNINAVLASSAGYINDNQYDLEVPFAAATNNKNPIYSIDRDGIYKAGQLLSSRLLTLSKSLNDTLRLSKFYTKPNGKFFVAFENGASTAAPAVATRSIYTAYLIGAAGEAPMRLITNAQSKFILAESALMLGTTGDANLLYQDGIKSSMSKVGMTTAEITKYFTDNPTVVNLSGTTSNKQKQIITQKYLAQIGNGIEAYNDYRRTGYPELAPALNAGGDNNGLIPLRLPYPSNEGNANANQPSPLPKTNVKVWWGK